MPRTPGRPYAAGVSWRFARRPSWILRHLLVLGMILAMINLGLWQLRRLDERRAVNDAITSRQVQDPVPVDSLIGVDEATDSARAERVEYRQVTARGTYLDDDTVLVANRTYNAAAGAWVLTPMRLDDGTGVVINRGFIGYDRDGGLRAPDAPDGEVTVRGLVQRSQHRGRFGPTDPTEGTLNTLARADLDRLGAQLDYPILPVLVQRQASRPDEAPPGRDRATLVPLDPPELGEGPHFSYAMQWFIFTTIAVVGYPLILRRVARQEAETRAYEALDGLDRELADLLRSSP